MTSHYPEENHAPHEARISNDLVREFHETFGHPVSHTPDLTEEAVSDELLRLRMDLIAEEFFELVGAALSPKARAYMESCWLNVFDDHLDRGEDGEYTRDLIEVADALGDLEYVIHGFAHVAGIPLPAVVEEIHSSNMSKLGDDGKPVYRHDGKILKGPGYFRPNIAQAMGMENPSPEAE